MIALLDACVLYPPALRDLFMWLATSRAYQPRWTEEIHAEWIRNVLEDRHEVTREQLERTRRLMNQVDMESVVSNYERHIPTFALPDANDRHALAAGIEAGADVIITFNLSDFPSVTLTAYDIEALHPDSFLSLLISTE